MRRGVILKEGELKRRENMMEIASYLNSGAKLPADLDVEGVEAFVQQLAAQVPLDRLKGDLKAALALVGLPSSEINPDETREKLVTLLAATKIKLEAALRENDDRGAKAYGELMKYLLVAQETIAVAVIMSTTHGEPAAPQKGLFSRLFGRS